MKALADELKSRIQSARDGVPYESPEALREEAA